MNKSTPLSQLPAINDSTKQIPPLAAEDDDATIQEVLNEINGSGGVSKQDSQQDLAYLQQLQMQQQLQQQQQYQQMQQLQQLQQLQQMQQQQQQQLSPDMMTANAIPPQLYPTQNFSEASGKNINMFFQHFGDDIKLALIVFVSVLIISFIPLTAIMSKYVALDKVPYSDLLLKSLFISFSVIILKKFVYK